MTDSSHLETAVARVQPTVLSLTEEAKALRISDAVSLEVAGEFLRLRVKAVLKQADEAFDPIIRAAHETHKVAVERKRLVTAPLLAAETVVKRGIAEYHAAAMEREAAERRRLQEQADAAAETERRRIEAERLEQAAALESEGRRDEASAMLDAPIVVQPAPLPQRVTAAPASPKGVSVRQVWRYRIKDPGLIKPEFLVPNEPAIAALVKAMGPSAIATVGAGIEVYADSVVASRAT